MAIMEVNKAKNEYGAYLWAYIRAKTDLSVEVSLSASIEHLMVVALGAQDGSTNSHPMPLGHFIGEMESMSSEDQPG